MGIGSFSGLKSGRGVTLTPHHLLVLWSRKSRAIPLLPLWAVRSVQSLSDCTRVRFLRRLSRGYHYQPCFQRNTRNYVLSVLQVGRYVASVGLEMGVECSASHSGCNTQCGRAASTSSTRRCVDVGAGPDVVTNRSPGHSALTQRNCHNISQDTQCL
jgi:hypothetical protein